MTDKWESKNSLKVDPKTGRRFLIKENERQIASDDNLTMEVRTLIDQAVDKIPKGTFGTKKIGWMVVVGFNLMRAKTFDYSSGTLTKFEDGATFEGAMQMVEDLRKKVYIAFGRKVPGVRQDLRGENE